MKGLLRQQIWPLLQLQLSSRAFCSSVSPGGVDKALLSKLRKQTGIPFINCKKALAKFDNDFDQAKKWLSEEAQKEGWARATKLQSRPMSQGLIAVMGNLKQATILEVNCETDFVAKNEKFIAMVTKLVQECNSHFEKLQDKKIMMDKSQLNEIVASEEIKLSDIVALNVGNLGENIAMRRGAFFRTERDSVLSHYIHPAGPNNSTKKILLGKYGALVEMRPMRTDNLCAMSLSDLGSHLCQHIVGMNPDLIGEYTPQESSTEDSDPSQGDETEEHSESDASLDEGGDQEVEEGCGQEEEAHQDALLLQEFLLDNSMSVGELLHVNGVEVIDFTRYACGEELPGDNKE